MKKLKQLLNRLRIWMILKLGGCLDPGPVIRLIDKKEFPIEKFFAETKMLPTRDPHVERACKYEALIRLMETVDQSEFIRWEIVHSKFNSEVIIRATMLLVNANDEINSLLLNERR